MLVLAAAAPARAAQATAGSDPLAFLSLDASARAASLGGAHAAAAEGSDALGYNPAGLALTRRHELSLMHEQLFASTARERVALALRQGFGVSADYVDYGKFERTTISRPDGGIGKFSARDAAAAAGWGFLIGDFAVGGAGKYIRSENDRIVAQTFAFDAGAIYRLPADRGIRFGAAIQNAGGAVKFQADREALPLTARGGVSIEFPALARRNLFAFDVVKTGRDRMRFNAGLETAGAVSGRIGWTTRNDAGIGLTAGVGFRGPDWSFDYALAPYGDLGLTHRLTLILRWGEERAPDRGQKFMSAYDEPVVERRLPPERKVRELPEAKPALPAGLAAPAVSPADRLLEDARMQTATGQYALASRSLDEAGSMLDVRDRRRVLLKTREGDLYHARKFYDDAAAAYEEAITMASRLSLSDSTVAAAYTGLGRCRWATGDKDAAARALRKAIDVEPTETRRLMLERYEGRSVEP